MIHTVPTDQWFVLTSFHSYQAVPFQLVEDLGGQLTIKHGSPFLGSGGDWAPLGIVFRPGAQVLVANSVATPNQIHYHAGGYYVQAD